MRLLCGNNLEVIEVKVSLLTGVYADFPFSTMTGFNVCILAALFILPSSTTHVSELKNWFALFATIYPL